MRPNAAVVSLIRFCGRLFELVVLNNRIAEQGTGNARDVGV